MPRNVRNFWIETRADGVNTVQATGPRAKDGGFTTTVKMRDAGSVSDALRIRGWIGKAGDLILEVEDRHGNTVSRTTTAR